MSNADRINDLTRQIYQVCASCPHMKSRGGISCDRKKSQCHSKRVRAWLSEIDKLENSKEVKKR